MSRDCWLGLLALALIATPVRASEALADKHACLNCHEVGKKLVGPAFSAVAQRYRGQAGADEVLLKKIAAGGTGVWGAVPMPPMPQVPAQDSRTLVSWILGL
jgi:cytochrome c